MDNLKILLLIVIGAVMFISVLLRDCYIKVRCLKKERDKIKSEYELLLKDFTELDEITKASMITMENLQEFNEQILKNLSDSRKKHMDVSKEHYELLKMLYSNGVDPSNN